MKMHNAKPYIVDTSTQIVIQSMLTTIRYVHVIFRKENWIARSKNNLRF